MPQQNPTPELVLASTSKYRAAQLKTLGVHFLSEKPLCDEDLLKNNFTDPYLMATGLAQAKARSLADQNKVIIGGDQLIHFKGLILGKPGTAERACAQLLKMQGQSHELITAVSVIHGEKEFNFTNTTRMHMRELKSDEIERYVEQDKPLDCAGAYKIESLGIALFSRIETDDFTAIQGLPLIELSSTLRKLGYKIP
jgi:septum formation protein